MTQTDLPQNPPTQPPNPSASPEPFTKPLPYSSSFSRPNRRPQMQTIGCERARAKLAGKIVCTSTRILRKGMKEEGWGRPGKNVTFRCQTILFDHDKEFFEYIKDVIPIYTLQWAKKNNQWDKPKHAKRRCVEPEVVDSDLDGVGDVPPEEKVVKLKDLVLVEQNYGNPAHIVFPSEFKQLEEKKFRIPLPFFTTLNLSFISANMTSFIHKRQVHIGTKGTILLDLKDVAEKIRLIWKGEPASAEDMSHGQFDKAATNFMCLVL
ncbi:hypothetical protein GYMLUDRAFT_252481 [Collybiopsis luxurians FD-317 M1]|uniref:Uncharacterized protein n=1 Tax=Collybiopsis luxurians FD-317 M1 TaxID=944289 RepID=A0A0D0BNA5_9AGAR|nr:hypothetical protein GYMLUDRAFT_252481 [Collybiopsis luxurians FD-317 M1]